MLAVLRKFEVRSPSLVRRMAGTEDSCRGRRICVWRGRRRADYFWVMQGHGDMWRAISTWYRGAGLRMRPAARSCKPSTDFGRKLSQEVASFAASWLMARQQSNKCRFVFAAIISLPLRVDRQYCWQVSETLAHVTADFSCSPEYHAILHNATQQ